MDEGRGIKWKGDWASDRNRSYFLSHGEFLLRGPVNRYRTRIVALREFLKNSIKSDKFTGFFDK